MSGYFRRRPPERNPGAHRLARPARPTQFLPRAPAARTPDDGPAAPPVDAANGWRYPGQLYRRRRRDILAGAPLRWLIFGVLLVGAVYWLNNSAA